MEAKIFVEAAPKLIESKLEADAINKIKQEVEAAGGVVEIK